RASPRLHRKPTLREVSVCHPWLEAEIALVRPAGIVCLGATALQALRGREARITRDHGQFFDTPWGAWLTCTLHPSALLRIPDPAARQAAHDQVRDDLERAWHRVAAAWALPRRRRPQHRIVWAGGPGLPTMARCAAGAVAAGAGKDDGAMRSLWDDGEARACRDDLALRVYTSQ